MQEVQKISKTRAVPSSVDMLRLADIKAFLNVPETLVSKVTRIIPASFLVYFILGNTKTNMDDIRIGQS